MSAAKKKPPRAATPGTMATSGEAEATSQPSTLGRWLAKAREDAGHTTRSLAAELAKQDGGSLGGWQVSIAQYETGVRAPVPERTGQICAALGLSPRECALAELRAAVEPELARICERYQADAHKAALDLAKIVRTHVE